MRWRAVPVSDAVGRHLIAYNFPKRYRHVIEIETVRTAEINKEALIVAAAQEKETTVIKAEGIQQEQAIKAEGFRQETEITAAGVLVQQTKEAEGTLAVGTAEAEAKRLSGMADVTPQLALAAEIGENEGYQTYLVQIRNVEKDEVVGVEQAKALQDAGIKVIANTGNVTDGVSNVMDLFTSASRSHAEVGLLEVHEVVLVEATELV